jgi:hypothetical protein
MHETPRLPRYQQMSNEAAMMLALGESGRFEFKRETKKVTTSLLAALANWVALDDTRDVAHLLVGVDEVKDPETGLVRGQVYGLAEGLDRAVSRIQDVASNTRPIPVDTFIIEEAVGEGTPFVRVEVRPTMPPHFDAEGRRQTRQGRSTRALTDEELLSVYLDREAGSFTERFRQTGEELRAAVGAVGTQVDEISDAIEQRIARPLALVADSADYAATAASSAEAAASDVGYDIQRVERIVRDLQDVVEQVEDGSAQALAARVAHQRRWVWWNFTVDTWERSSERSERLGRTLHDVLTADISVDSSRNSWELEVWDSILQSREDLGQKRATLKWWGETLREVVTFFERPTYTAADLPDLRAELRADFDKATTDPSSLTKQFREMLDSGDA